MKYFSIFATWVAIAASLWSSNALGQPQQECPQDVLKCVTGQSAGGVSEPPSDVEVVDIEFNKDLFIHMFSNRHLDIRKLIADPVTYNDRFNASLGAETWNIARVIAAKNPLEHKGAWRLWGYFSSETKIIRVTANMRPQDFWARAMDPNRDTRRMPDKNLFYVHGFYNDFNGTLKSTAEIAAAVLPGGRIFAYSWPSNIRSGSKSKRDYFRARDFALETSNRLIDRSRDIATNVGGSTTILAHSMGSLVLAEALHRSQADPLPIERVILAAPDISVEQFERKYMEAVLGTGRQAIMYCSDADEALEVAKSFDGGRVRIGDCLAKVHVYAGLESIAVRRDQGFMGHTIQTDSGQVLSDIAAVLGARSPIQRDTIQRSALGHWEFK